MTKRKPRPDDPLVDEPTLEEPTPGPVRSLARPKRPRRAWTPTPVLEPQEPAEDVDP